MIDETELVAINARSKLHIIEIVTEHRTSSDVLTWNLLHAIEERAFAQLKAAGDLDKDYLRMLQSPSVLAIPRTDDAVQFGHSNAVPAAFLFAVKAYRSCH